MDLKSNNGRNEPRKRASSWVFALAGVAAYLLLGALLALLLDWYINPGDPSEKKDLVQALALIMAGVAGAIGVYFTWRGQRQIQEEQELEAVRVKLEDPCVLGDCALDIFGSTFGLLGLYLH